MHTDGRITQACSRVLYHGEDGIVITGRTMDWFEDMHTSLWAFPAGMDRDGRAGRNSFSWTSQYGSVIASGYDNSTADGMNERGLVANILWLAESVYPPYDGTRPGLSLSLWAQYVLDTYATVEEAVSGLREEEFVPRTPPVPGRDQDATVHLSLSDAAGDSAIIEYIDGNLAIHHDRSSIVMTNSPQYEKQLALNEYWTRSGSPQDLPGSVQAPDRFARAWYYISHLPKTGDIQAAVAGVFSVIRNVSVPFGVQAPGQPHISTTIWRTVADHKRRVYFFESTMTPNIFWVEFEHIDLSPGAPVRMLPVRPDTFYAGDTAHLFREAEPFVFLDVTP